jgi:Fe-S-cluster-containing hydrogenase components 1
MSGDAGQLKTQVVQSEVELSPRPGDELLNSERLRQLTLFSQLKNPISVERLPGSIVLRRYRKGEVVCEQGSAGGTAFYIPFKEDLARLFAIRDKKDPEEEAAKVDPDRNRQVLTAFIFQGASTARRKGFLGGLFSSKKKSSSKISLIPNDGPSDIDYDTRQAPLMEGDVFGEMSCMTFSPRSATVIANQDCVLVEFNRNIFDHLQKDQKYRERNDAIYKERVLSDHLRRIELFADLTEKQMELLRSGVTLEMVEPGTIICEQGERPGDDPLDVFLVRSGVVQVVANATLSLGKREVSSWQTLCTKLIEEGTKPSEPANVQTSVARVTPAPKSAPAAGEKPKLSPLEIMEAARKAKMAKGGDAPTAAAAEKSPAPSPSVPGAAKKPSVAEIMEAARKAKAAREAGAPKAATVQEVIQELKKTQSTLPKTDEPAAKKPSVAEILAAARKKKEESGDAPAAPAEPAAEVTPEPAAEAPAKKPSVAEILAAARKKKDDAGDAPAASAEPAAEVTPGPAAEAPAKKPSVAEIIAAAKKAKLAEASARAENAPSPKKPEESAGSPPPVAAPASFMTAESEAIFVPADDFTAVREFPRVNRDSLPPSPPPSPPPAPVESAVAEATPPAEKPRVPLLRSTFPKSATTPEQVIWGMFSDEVQAACRSVADRDEHHRENRMIVLDALNALLRSREFLASKPLESVLQHRTLQERICTFPNGTKGIKDLWSEPDVRIAGRTVLAHLFPTLIKPPGETGGPPRILAYLTRGDCFGEVSAVLNVPRQATCIAYDHPISGSKRKPGRVELVRISGRIFKQLMQESPRLLERARKIAEERRGSSFVPTMPTGTAAMVSSPQFENLGLFQGNRLLLIDLDRCTRCGECVQACVNTHDDGYTRLFLDGPRFDRFLIPSACRNCLNPSCMIGCPVGAITRGANGQIEIQDWCIGCSLCAEQCPYDSIQMHDLGVIPEQSLGWMIHSAKNVPSNWTTRKWMRKRWGTGMAPFYWNPSFFAALNDPAPEGFCLRHLFDLSPDRKSTKRYQLEMKSCLENSKIWLNGTLLECEKKDRKGTWITSAEISASQLRRRNNLLCVELLLGGKAPAHGDAIFSLRLDAVPEGGARTKEVLEGVGKAEFKLVTQRAAVCDLCSDLPGQQPACVTSCPHDAAIRTNPLVNFPL